MITFLLEDKDFAEELLNYPVLERIEKLNEKYDVTEEDRRLLELKIAMKGFLFDPKSSSNLENYGGRNPYIAALRRNPALLFPVIYLANSYQYVGANDQSPVSLAKAMNIMAQAVEEGEKVDHSGVRTLADITIKYGKLLIRHKDNFALDPPLKFHNMSPLTFLTTTTRKNQDNRKNKEFNYLWKQYQIIESKKHPNDIPFNRNQLYELFYSNKLCPHCKSKCTNFMTHKCQK